jgi:hypothetical protein
VVVAWLGTTPASGAGGAVMGRPPGVDSGERRGRTRQCVTVGAPGGPREGARDWELAKERAHHGGGNGGSGGACFCPRGGETAFYRRLASERWFARM